MPRHKSCICHVGDIPYLNQSQAVQSYNLSFCIFVLAMFCNFDSLVSLHRLVLLSMLTTCRLTCHTQSLMPFLATQVLLLATQMLFLATHTAITTKHHPTLKPLLHTSAPTSNIKGGRVGFEISCNSIEHKASQAREGRPLYPSIPAPPLQHPEPS